jgi:endo-1,3-1,4-beta-glycanase ExoK
MFRRFGQIPAASAALLLLAAMSPGTAEAAGGTRKVETAAFVERFDTVEGIDEGRWRVSDGWANGAGFGTDWRRSQMQAGPDGIEVSLERNPDSKKGYSSGEIQSHGFYGHGYYEIRMRAARGNGLVTGFFTYTGSYFGDRWNELDVEILGRDTRMMQINYFTDGKPAGAVDVPLPFDAADGLNTYGIEWLPDRINWYVNGKQVHTETGSRLPLPDRPQKIYFHLWNGVGKDDWLKPFRWEGKPFVAGFDCIAYRPVRTEGPSCADGDDTASAD